MKKRNLLILALGILLLFGVLRGWIPLSELSEPAQTPQAAQASPDFELPPPAEPSEEPESPADESPIDEDGSYTSKEDLALYLHTYGHLPPNFVSKKTARAAGWNGGSLEPYYPGMCIGGDYFGNYEGQLPKAKGRSWMECDVNTLGRDSRGAERIVWSNDGLIYYTPDHYQSWELLYGNESVP